MIACRVIDETDIRVGGKSRYLWRAVDANGQMLDFRLTIAGSRYAVSMRGARRDAKAPKAFANKAIERVRRIGRSRSSQTKRDAINASFARSFAAMTRISIVFGTSTRRGETTVPRVITLP